MSRTVYEQLGGFVVVRKIVTEFYNNVLDNEELATFFSTTDMERLIDHQTKFISMLLGGPVSYTEEQLQMIHSRLKIGNNHFDLIKETLIETFEDFDLSEDHIEFVSNEYENRRSLIVTI